jgi:hypothetical protein
MSAPSVVQAGVGFRNLYVFALDGSGYPAATTTQAYEGLKVSGVRQLTITDPAPRLITHVGDDAPFALDSLPALDPVTGQLTLSKQNDTLDALLTGQKSFLSAAGSEQYLFGVGTDLRGYEVQVGALMYRQSEDVNDTSSTFGARNWQFRLMPKTLVIPLENGYDDTPEARSYEVRPGFVTSHLWGTQFSLTTEGFTRAQVLRGVSQYKPALVAFKSGGVSPLTYTLPTTRPAASTAKMSVWVNGVLVTASMTKYTTGIAFADTTSAPTTGANVSVFYETA